MKQASSVQFAVAAGTGRVVAGVSASTVAVVGGCLYAIGDSAYGLYHFHKTGKPAGVFTTIGQKLADKLIPDPESEPEPKRQPSTTGAGSRGPRKPIPPTRFRGPAAKEFDWFHIINNHAAWGRIARQRTGANMTVFPAGWTEADIKARVLAAWNVRKKIETEDGPNGVRRIKYEGIDPTTKTRIRFWFNQNTRIVETAYPKY